MIKRERFRKKNRQTRFSGSAVREERGFGESLFTPKYSSHAEAVGEYGEREISSLLEDLDSEEYQVFNDLLIRNGKYGPFYCCSNYPRCKYILSE